MVSSTANQNFTAASPKRPKSKFKKFLGICGWILVVIYFLFMGTLLAIRYLLFPYLDSEKPLIEEKVSQLIGVPVSIGSIKATWYYLDPAINLKDIRVGANDDLQIEEATAALSFFTIFRLQPVFDKLSVINPVFTIKRAGPYHYEILGKKIDLEEPSNENKSSKELDLSALDWIFRQKFIEISNGHFQIIGPNPSDTFAVTDINLLSNNSTFTKQFALELTPPKDFATPLSLKGELSPSNPLAIYDINNWDGNFYLKADKINFAEIAQFIPIPNVQYQGLGGGEIWLDTKGWRPYSATFIGSMSAVKLTLGEKLEPLQIDYYKGKITVIQDGSNYRVINEDLSLQLASGVVIDNLNTEFDLKLSSEDKIESVSFKANRLDLTSIANCFPSLPIPEDIKDFVIKRKLYGTLTDLSVNYAGNPEDINSYSGTVGFENLYCESYVPDDGSELWFPGFRNLTGSITFNNSAGELILKSQDVQLDVPKLFQGTDFSVSNLQAHGTWRLKPLSVDVDKLVIENDDLAIAGTAAYRDDGSKLGFLDAHADLPRIKPESIWKYVPLVAGESTINWLHYGLVSGTCSQGAFDFVGQLDKFPFKDSPDYKFEIKTNVSDATIDFLPIKFSDPSKANQPGAVWPTLSGVGAVVSVGDGMHADVSTGKYKDVNISKGTIDIPTWYTPVITMTIDASAQGPLETFLEYVNTSPIKDYTGGFFDKAKGNGPAALDLALTIPFGGDAGIKVDGACTLNGTAVSINQFQIPNLTDVAGTVTFSEKGAAGSKLTAKNSGLPITASFDVNEKGAVNFNVAGTANSATIQQVIPDDYMRAIAKNYLVGRTPFTLKGSVNGSKVNLDATATLVGMEIKLPAPMTKDAASKKQMTFSLANDKNNSDISFSLEETIVGRIVLKNGVVDRAAIGRNKAPNLPARGYAINYDTPYLSVAEWDKVLSSGSTKNSKKSSSTTASLPVLDSINIIIDDLRIENFDQKNFALSGSYSSTGWDAQIYSDQMNGTITWKTSADKSQPDSLDIVISALYIPASAGSAADNSTPIDIPGGWPSVNAIINNLNYGNIRLGNVELAARPVPSKSGHLWKINKLVVKNPDYTLNASGSWLKDYKGGNRTTLIIDNAIADLGKMIERFDLGKLVKGGRGSVKGDLAWNGSPLAFDYKNFDGHLDISFGKGEILKIEPGAGAKLLTLLSLQSLSKYLTLDFRDFYSKGFNFDSIIGEAKIDKGVMDIMDLTTVGSGATVVMNGNVNLKKETENLNILVLPDVHSTSASIALAVANPIAGIGSFLAQLVLKDPLSRMFSFQYAVTGTWSDPVVKKVEKNNTEKQDDKN